MSVSRAVLVSIRLPHLSLESQAHSLAELERLVDTLGLETVARLSQARTNLKSPTVLGEGKLRELAALTGGTGEVPARAKWKPNKARLRELEADEADEESDVELLQPEDELTEEPSGASSEADPDAALAAAVPPSERAQVVVFDCDLSPSQMGKLEQATGAKVLDRTGVIIEIFSRHARSRAAKLQVEMARLAYVSPRARETGGGRQGGGIGGKGSGESKLELDRRRIRDRIKEISDQLANIATDDRERRERRAQENTIALLGYTNAGKSSMMRALTGSGVLVEDKLFATLDTTVRPLHPLTIPRVLVSDTVGFIQKLPHDLVASFRSTLEEALNASLLVYIVDAADPAFRQQLEVTRTVLAEIGAGKLPQLLVLNKADMLDSQQLDALRSEFPDAMILSALVPADVARLRDRLLAHFETGMVDQQVFVPYDAQGVIGKLREAMRVLSEEYCERGVTLKVRAHPRTIARFEPATGNGM
jgi:GTP-binding protein HflX